MSWVVTLTSKMYIEFFTFKLCTKSLNNKKIGAWTELDICRVVFIILFFCTYAWKYVTEYCNLF